MAAEVVQGSQKRLNLLPQHLQKHHASASSYFSNSQEGLGTKSNWHQPPVSELCVLNHCRLETLGKVVSIELWLSLITPYPLCSTHPVSVLCQALHVLYRAQSLWEGVSCKHYIIYERGLSTCRLWCPWRSWKQSPSPRYWHLIVLWNTQNLGTTDLITKSLLNKIFWDTVTLKVILRYFIL